jgi:rRNA small subunit pseudouridine methyltransferase Nep1
VLTVILADAEVELVPQDIAGHPAIREPARVAGRKPTEMLLDQNSHGAAMGRMTDGKRRGRPDIVHYCLLTLLESPLCKAGGLRVSVHTRHGELVQVRSDTRLPRGEARFQGLLAKVLREGASHDKQPLLWSEGQAGPADILAKMARGPVVRLDEGGTPLAPARLAELGQDLTVVLGAFPSGGFSEAWLAAAPEAVSLWPEPLNAWAVAGEVVAAHRAKWGPEQPAKPQP